MLTSPLPIWLWSSLVQKVAAAGVGTATADGTDARGLIDCTEPRQLPALIGNKKGHLQVAAYEEASLEVGTTDEPTATLRP